MVFSSTLIKMVSKPKELWLTSMGIPTTSIKIAELYWTNRTIELGGVTYNIDEEGHVTSSLRNTFVQDKDGDLDLSQR